MKYVLVDNYDTIVHTVVLNGGYTQTEAQRYFVNLKRMDEKDTVNCKNCGEKIDWQ